MIFYKRGFFRIVSYFLIEFVHTVRIGLISCLWSLSSILLSFELIRMHIFRDIMLIFILIVEILMLRWLLFIHIPIRGCLLPVLICDDHLHEFLMSYLALIFIRWADYTFVHVFIWIIQVVIMSLIVRMHGYWWVILQTIIYYLLLLLLYCWVAFTTLTIDHYWVSLNLWKSFFYFL